ncbi:MAG TPA: S9 family peptidase [Longimicrobiales bacterium]|nr:S9 family peptidase [Longimicrobiales bacterium]
MRTLSFALSRTLVAALVLALVSALPAAAQRAMTPRDLWSLARVGAPALSPDGRRVLYPVTSYDLESFRSRTEIWAVPTTGGTPERFITSETGNNSAPAWSPDGSQIAFVSTRDRTSQLYLMPAAGGAPRQLTNVTGGVRGPVWSRDGSRIVFVSSVVPAGDPQAERLQQLAARSSEAKIYDELMYRHWDAWEDAERDHVFVIDIASGETRDLTPGPFDSPPIALGGFQDYDVSPDGAEVAFVRNPDVPNMVGTGNDIWLVPSAGGEPVRLTTSAANDVAPQYSPDGRFIAYLAMERPGFEADRTQLMIYDRATEQARSITAALDRSVDFFTWSADSRTIWFLAQDELNHSIYRVALDGKPPVQVTKQGYFSALAVARDGRTLVVARQGVDRPVDLYALDANGRERRRLTNQNGALLEQLALQPVEPFWFEGAEGARVQGFMVRPPNFDSSRKYPVVYLIHGGPQGAWTDSWSYRWNPNQFAAPGYVVVATNPRGSTGYGQKFTDEISQDWGGRVYTDLMNGLDHALATYEFLDKNRLAAAGASYGGYMINWINGQTDRFRALINHDGLFDTRSMYFATEELWFPEWEFGGTPWENPEGFDRWNPANHVANMNTPTLIIHGGLDYRVPLEQGIATFTALRRRDVPARLLYFPDEGHWVLKPQNAFVWWDTMLDWLHAYLRDTDATE